MNIKIEQSFVPDCPEVNFLTQQLSRENEGFGGMHAFCFFIRDEDNQVIAGCNGFLMFGSVYTDQLWVHPKYRKLGLGGSLMRHVHDYACVNACAIATVVTMSFQGAIEFYEKLGYEVDFERDGYINGSSCVFLKKMFKQDKLSRI